MGIARPHGRAGARAPRCARREAPTRMRTQTHVGRRDPGRREAGACARRTGRIPDGAASPPGHPSAQLRVARILPRAPGLHGTGQRQREALSPGSLGSHRGNAGNLLFERNQKLPLLI